MKKIDEKSKLKTESHSFILGDSVRKNKITTKSDPFKAKPKDEKK